MSSPLIFVVAAVVLSTETTPQLCQNSSSACSNNRAAQAFVWLSFILRKPTLQFPLSSIASPYQQLITNPYPIPSHRYNTTVLIHLTLLTYTTFQLSSQTHTSFFRILQTPHEDLVLFTSNHTQPSHRAMSPFKGLGLGGKRKTPPQRLNLMKSNTQGSLISLPIYRTFASTNAGATVGPQAAAPVPPKPNRHMMMAMAQPEEEPQPQPHPVYYHTRKDSNNTDATSVQGSAASDYDYSSTHPYVHKPVSPQDQRISGVSSIQPVTLPSIRHSNSSDAWQAPDSWAVGSHSNDSHTTITTVTTIPPLTRTSTRDSQRESKQLPPLPNLQLASLRKPVQAAVGPHRTSGGVVDRPDPRDRRPPGIGDIASEGGFWVTKATRMNGSGTGKGKGKGVESDMEEGVGPVAAQPTRWI